MCRRSRKAGRVPDGAPWRGRDEGEGQAGDPLAAEGHQRRRQEEEGQEAKHGASAAETRGKQHGGPFDSAVKLS